MAYKRYLSPKFLIFVPLLLVLMMAVACGEEEADTDAIAAKVQEGLKDTVQQAVKDALPAAVSAEDIRAMVETAVASIPEGATTDEIKGLVSTAVSDAVAAQPSPLTSEQVGALVSAAVAEIPEGASAADVEALVSTAVAKIPKGASAAEIEALVSTAVGEFAAETKADVAALAQAVSDIPAPVATPTPTPARALVTSKTKTLIIVFGPPTSERLTPWGDGEMAFRRPLFEFLGSVDRFTGAREPQLAEKFTLSPDAITLSFQLRKNVPFHSGFGDITSADWAHVVERAKSDAVDWRGSDRSTTAGFVEVKTPDDYTLELVQPQPGAFSILFNSYGHGGAFVGSSKAYWDAEGAEGYEAQPIGTGPYRFVRWNPGVGVTYERVVDHWRVIPEFQQMQHLFASEASTRQAMLLAGEAHMITQPRDLEPTLDQAGFRVTRSTLPATIYGFAFGGMHFEFDELAAAGFDMDAGRSPSYPRALDDDYFIESPWAHPVTGLLVREAMNRAIDRDEIQDTIFRGGGDLMKIYGFHPTEAGWNTRWETEFDEKYGFDPVKAQDLLTQAGWPNGFPVKMVVFPHSFVPENVNTMEVVAGYLTDIGLDVSLETRTFDVRRQQARDRVMQGQVAAFFGGYRDVERTARSYYAEPGAGSVYENLFTWQNYDELKAATLPVARDQIIRALGDHLFDNYSGMPLINVRGSVVVDPAVVAEYAFPGNVGGVYSHTEYVSAADPS